MNLMTVFLQAPAAAPGGGSMMWILLIAMFAIMYFFHDSSTKQKAKRNCKLPQIASGKPKSDYCRRYSWCYQRD